MLWIHKCDTVYQSPSVATKLSELPFDELSPKPTATSKTNETPKSEKEKTFMEEIKSIMEKYKVKKTKSACKHPTMPPSPKSKSTYPIQQLHYSK